MYKEAFSRGYNDMLDYLVKQAQNYDDTGRMRQALNDANSTAYGMKINERPGTVSGHFDLSMDPEIRREQLKRFKIWNDGRVIDVHNDGARLSWNWTSPYGRDTEAAPAAPAQAAPAVPAQAAPVAPVTTQVPAAPAATTPAAPAVPAQAAPAAPAQAAPVARRPRYRSIPAGQQTRPVVNHGATERRFNEYNAWQRSVAAQEADRARGIRRVARPPVNNSWIPEI